jgi:branched-chain amino acid aminotransferase
VRLCVTRGTGTLGLNPFLCEQPTLFIIADAVQLYTADLYEQGMHVVTAATRRTPSSSLPAQVKSMNYLNNILAKIEAIDAGAPEAVMLNHEGFVSECTGDNVFIVRTRSGRPRLVTPPLHAGILEGVTRNVVLELAADLDCVVEERDLTRHDLYNAEEMLLTGTAAEVVPVTQVDGRAVGEGRPGPTTRELIQKFRALVRERAPED